MSALPECIEHGCRERVESMHGDRRCREHGRAFTAQVAGEWRNFRRLREELRALYARGRARRRERS